MKSKILKTTIKAVLFPSSSGFSERSVSLFFLALLVSFGLMPVAFASEGVATEVCQPTNKYNRSKITLLGTSGGPISRKIRSQPASLLTIDKVHYLIDAGAGVTRQLTQADVALTDIRQIFLSHLHGDHVAGLAPLLMFDWVLGAKRPVGVYGPPGTNTFLAAAIDYISIPVEIFRSQYPPRPQLNERFLATEPEVKSGIDPTLIYTDELVKVWAVENSHYATMKSTSRPYGRDKSYSYRFDTPERSIVFTGDTGPSKSLIELSRDADVLVTEVIDLERQIQIMRNMTQLPDKEITALVDHMKSEHITPEKIGMLATAASVKQIVLTHIVPGLDHETDVTPYIKGIRKYYSGPISFGMDLACF